VKGARRFFQEFPEFLKEKTFLYSDIDMLKVSGAGIIMLFVLITIV